MRYIKLNRKSSGATVTEQEVIAPDWEEHKIVKIGALLARKAGETYAWSSRREVYATHHRYELQTGQTIKIDWREVAAMVRQDAIQKVRLRSRKAIIYARLAERGDIDWTTALRRIAALGAISDDEQIRVAKAGEVVDHE